MTATTAPVRTATGAEPPPERRRPLGARLANLVLPVFTGLAVFFTVIIGMPLAVLVGTRPRARTVITWFLDLMQTMPTFVYLLPVVLFFGIGVSAAVVSAAVESAM